MVPRHARWNTHVLWAACALPAVLLWPLLLGDVPAGFDALRFFVPLVTEAARLLHAGELPIWTDRVGGGFPLWASSQAPVWYPPAWPLLWSNNAPRWTGVYLVAHQCLAAWGGARMARRAGLSRQAQVLCAVVCGASLPAVFLTNRPGFSAATAWAPHAYAAVVGHRVRGWELGLTVGMATCVCPQMDVAYLLGAVALGLLWRPQRARLLVPLKDAAASWGLVAAPLVVPFVELLPWTDRGRGGHFDPHQHALDPAQWLQWLSPGVLGAFPSAVAQLFELAPDRARLSHATWMASLSPAVLVTACVLWAVLSTRRARRVALLVAACLVLGTSLVPGVAWVWQHPPLSAVRFPAKAWHVAIPLVALLAGVGLDRWRRRKSGLVVLGGLVLAHALLLVTASPVSQWLGTVSTREDTTQTLLANLTPSLWCSVAWLLLCAGGLALGGGRRVVLVLGVLEMCTWTLSLVMVRPPAPPVNSCAAQLAAELGDGVRLLVGPAQGGPAWWNAAERMAWERHASQTNLPLQDGAALLMSGTGIRLRGVRLLENVLQSSPARWCAALRCQALLLDTQTPAPVGMVARKTFEDVGLTAWTPQPPLPEVRCAKDIIVVPPQALPHALLDANINLATDALVDQPLDAQPGTCDAHVTLRRAQSVEIEVKAPQPSLMWTADPMGPGWTVTVNGVEQPEVLVHGALRGVVVPQGASTVVWRQGHGSYAAGFAVSLLCGLWLWTARARRQTAAPSKA